MIAIIHVILCDVLNFGEEFLIMFMFCQQEALEETEKEKASLHNYDVQKVGLLHINHLIANQDFQKAAR